MNIRKKWIAMVLAFTMAVSPLPGAAVRAESTEPAGEEIVVLEAAEEAEADAESLGEVEVQEGETADEGTKAEEKETNPRYSYTWFYLRTISGTYVEIGTEGEEEELELGKRLVEKYNKGGIGCLKCQCRDINDTSSEVPPAEAYPSVSDKIDETFPANCAEEGKITFVVDFNFGEHKLGVTLPKNPNAHTELVYEKGEDATCEEEGHVAGYTCQGCGKHFLDPGAETEIAKDSWVIPAKSHDWAEWEVTKSSTCTKKGERIRTCKRDASHVEKGELPEDPKAHTLVSTAVKAPTCTENGNSAYYTCQ